MLILCCFFSQYGYLLSYYFNTYTCVLVWSTGPHTHVRARAYVPITAGAYGLAAAGQVRHNWDKAVKVGDASAAFSRGAPESLGGPFLSAQGSSGCGPGSCHAKATHPGL